MKLFLNRLRLKFQYAFSGLIHGVHCDHSIRIQYGFALLACLAGVVFHFEVMEWIFIVFAIILVIALEYINSAIEHLCDITSPQFDETVKIIKDYCAAAVLVASIGALVVGFIIIGGKL